MLCELRKHFFFPHVLLKFIVSEVEVCKMHISRFFELAYTHTKSAGMVVEMSPEFAIIRMQGPFLVYQLKELSQKSLCSPSVGFLEWWLRVRVPNKVMGRSKKIGYEFF